MVSHNICFICSICGESVEVATCVTDEFGKPAHELCYVEKLMQDSQQQAQAATAEGLRSSKVA